MYVLLSPSQRRGLMYFYCICLVLVILKVSLRTDHRESVNLSAFPSINQFQKTKADTFDVNLASMEDWVKLNGIGKVLGHRIIKYRAAIGGFKMVEDLYKVYGIDSSIFVQNNLVLITSDYTQTKTKDNFHTFRPTFKRQQRAKILMNAADTINWKSLPGIGTVLSKRIVKYRSIKGGFRSKEEIRQVYGIDSNLYKRIAEYLVLDSVPHNLKEKPQKINTEISATKEYKNNLK